MEVYFRDKVVKSDFYYKGILYDFEDLVEFLETFENLYNYITVSKNKIFVDLTFDEFMDRHELDLNPKLEDITSNQNNNTLTTISNNNSSYSTVNRYYHTYYSSSVIRKEQKVETDYVLDVGILLLSNTWFYDLYLLSKKYNTEIGFFGQVLYFEYRPRIYIGIPVYIFTIPMEVGVAEIYYEHKDINRPICKEKVNELIKLFKDIGLKIKNVKVANNFSIHKHPGPSKFSAGDFSISATTPGILRRYQEFNGITFDLVFHDETISDIHIAKVNVSKDDEYYAAGQYSELRSIGIIDITDPLLGKFTPALDINQIEPWDEYQIITRNIDEYRYEVVLNAMEILDELINYNYVPKLELKPEHFKKKEYRYYSDYRYPYNKTNNTSQQIKNNKQNNNIDNIDNDIYL